MTADFDKSVEQAHNTQSETFLEPRTIPKKWDVSSFGSAPTPSRDGNSAESTASTETGETNTVEESGSDTVLDPFPQPRTVPSNWDVSDLV